MGGEGKGSGRHWLVMNLATVVMEAEEAYNIVIPEEDWNVWVTVGDLKASILRQMDHTGQLTQDKQDAVWDLIRRVVTDPPVGKGMSEAAINELMTLEDADLR